MIGLGNSGKTSFINTLLGAEIKIEKTDQYWLYEGIQKIPLVSQIGKQNGHVTHHVYISDYMGQNIGTLVGAFIWQQKKLFSPISYGHINTLIVMVDVLDEFSPPGKPDEKRIAQHLEQWNATALDAIWGLLHPKSLKYVCLFINKRDALEGLSEPERSCIIAKFEPLRKLLEKRCKPRKTGIDLEVYFGSTNGGFASVVRKLWKHSVDSRVIPEIRLEDVALEDDDNE